MTDKYGAELRPGNSVYSERSTAIKAKVISVDERVIWLQPRGGGPVALTQQQMIESSWRKL